MGMLHNSRYQLQVERATTALYESLGFCWAADVADNPDQFHVVRRFEVEHWRPFAGAGMLEVRLWIARLGETSCRYRFACLGAGGTVHASGERVIVKLDPRRLRPVPWTDAFRQRQLHLLALDENPRDA